MARSDRSRGAKFAANPQGVRRAEGFFSSVDATTERVDQWDVKQEQLVRAILRLLASGRSIGFYTAWHGQAVNISVYSGDSKDPRGARDSIEFDQLIEAINRRLDEEDARLEQ